MIPTTYTLPSPVPLPFATRKRNTAICVSALIRALEGRGWRSAKALGRELGMTDRAIRELASQSDGQIISGQRGYRTTHDATVAEVQHAANWLRSQARQMEQRAYAIERAMHRRTA